MNITAAGEHAQLAPSHPEYLTILHSRPWATVARDIGVSSIMATIMDARAEPHVMLFSEEELIGLHDILAARQSHYEAQPKKREPVRQLVSLVRTAIGRPLEPREREAVPLLREQIASYLTQTLDRELVDFLDHTERGD